jgi:hypothetical protein
MMRSDVNNAARERMRAQRTLLDDWIGWRRIFRFVDGSQMGAVVDADGLGIGINTSTRDMQSYVPVGTRVRIEKVIGGGTFYYTFVTSVSYASPFLTLGFAPVLDAATWLETVHVDVCVLPELGALAWEDTITSGDFIIPADFTDTGLGDAIDLANVGGGIVLLGIGTYDITSTHEVHSGVTIMGRSPGASNINLGTAASLAVALKVPGGEDGVRFTNFTITGKPTAGNGRGILVAATASGVNVDNVYFNDLAGHGIRVATDVHDVSITNCEFTNLDQMGISSVDANTSNYGITVSGCRFADFGLNLTDSAGIFAVGEWAITNCHFSGLDMIGPNSQRGVWLGDQQGASPNQQDAHACSVTGCSVSGTGQNAIGIQVGGRDCAISGCAITLPGNVSRGIYVEGPSGTRNPTENAISGCSMHACNIGVLIGSASDFNAISGCSMGEGVTAISCAGNSNVISACSGKNQTGDAVSVTGDRNVLTSINLNNAGLDAISLSAASSENYLDAIRSNGHGSLYVDNTGTDNILDTLWNDEYVIAGLGSSTSIPATSEKAVIGVEGLSFPGDVQPDGFTKYRVQWINSGSVLVGGNFRMGPLGTIGDPVDHAYEPSQSFFVVPAAGDLWTLTGDNGTGSPLFTNYGFTMERVRGFN